MSIETEISRITNAKANIKSAIEAKGVSVSDTALIDTYANSISQISGGGSVDLPVSIANGGTGSTTALTARTALGATPYVSSFITNGTIAASGTANYTASYNCVFYLIVQAQANSSYSLSVTYYPNAGSTGTTLFSFSTSAISLNVCAIPIYLKAGDKITITQVSNYSSSYRVFSLQ